MIGDDATDRLPATLSHFYKPATGPFRSISELSESDAADAMRRMREGDDTYSRFTAEHRDPYMRARRKSEARLFDAFIKKGGKPKRRSPYYLILDTPGTETFFPQDMRLAIPLDRIPAEVVSFTYLDSMCCDLILEHDPDGMLPPGFLARFAGLPCLREVYRLSELPALLQEYGPPEKTYIEAQVWDDEPLRQYRNANTEPGAIR